MTKLRGKLLITLVLTAVLLSALQVGNASALARVRTTTTTKTVQTSLSYSSTPTSPNSGEPDAGNGTKQQ